MAKTRIEIPAEIRSQVLFEQDHTCCMCRERGLPTQIHHIDDDPSNNNPENLAVLCLTHHNETQVKGGFATKTDAMIVTRYRDDWINRVKQRRDDADKLAVGRMSGTLRNAGTGASSYRPFPSTDALIGYINGLPEIRRGLMAAAQPRWDTGNTTDMRQGNYDVIDGLAQVWIRLTNGFPENHFGKRPAGEYISEFQALRFAWHRAVSEPGGVGTGGTIVGVLAGGGVMDDIVNAITETVQALGRWEGFDTAEWTKNWIEAGNPQG